MGAEEVDAWLIDAQSAVADSAAMLQFRIPDDVAYADLLAETAERLFSLQFALEDQLFQAEESAEQLVRRNDELQAEAATDALTKLPNRRAFDRRLAAAMELSSPGLGLLMLDLDHFKAVNDSHGHAAGDDVLRAVGATLERQTRGDDFTARFGGEEFVMLIPSTSAETLLIIAERLRTAIAELVVPLRDGGMISVTTSIGGAMLASSPDIQTPRALIEAADQQLYEAKQGGRNRTCLR
jgi:diguanylate cyclase (GGDEF)-like protein